MNKAEIIKGIDLTLEGLKTIREALAGEEVAPKTPTKNVYVESVTEPNKNDDVQASLELNIDVDKLKAMKYNEFKKFASSLGVKCTGTRDEIMARIVALKEAPIEVEVEEESDVEEAPIEKSNIKKFEKKVEEPEKDEFDLQAEAVAEETAIEDIIEVLESVDLKATKRNAVTLLAKALREGLIELEDDEDEAEEELEEEDIEEVEEDTAEEEADEEEETEIDASAYFSQFDPEGYNDPEGMSKERAKAIVSKMKEVLTAFYDEELTEDDIVSYLEDNATEEELELLDDDYTTDDLLMFYMELVKRTIDNDGEEHEPSDPYEVGNNDMCCGHELKYIKKTQKYVCEHCGTEYEAE